MRHPVGFGEPIRRVDGDGLGVARFHELSELVVDLVAESKRAAIPFAVAGDRAGEGIRSAHVDVLDGAGAAERCAFDLAAAVGEDEIPVGRAELESERVRVALPRRVDPHVDLVVAHRAGQDKVELVPAEQPQRFAAAPRRFGIDLGGQKDRAAHGGHQAEHKASFHGVRISDFSLIRNEQPRVIGIV